MSTLNVNRIVDASGGVMAPISSVFKNRIINGACVIDQRNAGASVTPTSGQYTLDRYQVAATQTGKYSVEQTITGVGAPIGFTDYLGVTSLSAYSVLSTDVFNVRQAIEGYNIADLMWGTANAKTVTLSFWVRSSLTGTFGGSLRNGAADRSYPYTYTISSANTWEYKTVTIAGDTTGTWNTTNGIGVQVIFSLGAGATLSNTAGAWAAGSFVSATGATSVVGTNGATFYVTGVQLEKGSTATPFERRQFGTELALCQRYYQQYGGDDTLTTMSPLGTGINSTQARVPFVFPVPMRVAPSVTQLSAGIADGVNAVVALTAIAISTNQGGKAGSNLITTVSSGITQYRPYWVLGNSNTSSYIAFSGEL